MENTVISGLFSVSQNPVISLDLKNGSKVLEMYVTFLIGLLIPTNVCLLNCKVLTMLGIRRVYSKWIAINDKEKGFLCLKCSGKKFSLILHCKYI